MASAWGYINRKPGVMVAASAGSRKPIRFLWLAPGASIVILVCNNEGIGGRGLQETAFPKGSHGVASLLPANYEKMAEMVDGHAEYVEKPDEIAPALQRAPASNRPAIVHVRIDPFARRVGGRSYIG